MLTERSSTPAKTIQPWQILLILIPVAVLVLWRSAPHLTSFFGTTGGPVALREVTPRAELFENEKSVIELYKRTKKSVVNVTSVIVQREFRSRNVLAIPQGMGTGIVWDKLGHIVTNFHVVGGANEFVVTLDDGSKWEATPIGFNRDVDLCVLRIAAPAAKLFPIELGESKNLVAGQSAYAIGNPFGLDQSLGAGIISALDRDIENRQGVTISGAIQTTAPINPGNSGGPLLDSAGRLIGVNTAILSPSGAWAGIGFALPVDRVNEVVTKILNQERQ
jgi:S1-C subfamily serine protease